MRWRGDRTWIIAEAGVNHNGDPELAHRLVDAAAGAGADAVKFQTFDPEQVASSQAGKAGYQRRGTEDREPQLALLRGLQLPREAYPALIEHCLEAEIEFLSSAFDEQSVDLLLELGADAIKFSSGELTNHPLLAYAARASEGIIVSTGMATLDEVDGAVEAVRAAGGDVRLALLHCVSAYPAPPEQSNLRAIAAMGDRYSVPVGWSDHTLGVAVAIGAVAAGAVIVEKHLTLDRGLPGPDHRASLEPDEFSTLVAGIRTVEVALGDGIKRPTPAERDVAEVARKSLHARRTLQAGEPIHAEDLIALRPGTGIPPYRLPGLIGRTVRRDVRPGAMLRESDVA